MRKDFLPVGSVVLLKHTSKKLMICGILQYREDSADTLYDYIGVLYPEGFMGDTGNILFNHDDIADVIFNGYDNPERQEFLAALSEVIEAEQEL